MCGVTEHDAPRPDEPQPPVPPGQEPEDTAPLGQQGWSPTPPPYGPGGYLPPHYNAPPTAAYPVPGYPGLPRHTHPGSVVPGWLWPLVAVSALVVGLLGGVLGGVLVSTTVGSGGGTVDEVTTDKQAAAPLPASNGSVAAVAQRLLPSTVQVLANGGADGSPGGGATGSGFVLDSKGHVITNNHVVADATGPGELTVVDQSGKEHKSRIVGRSPVYDIAVLEVQDAKNLRPAALGSSQALRVGDPVVAIGSPLGLSSTVTSGIVSALDRPVTTGSSDQSSYINAVQTDAAINPGNSGGPLVNLRGEVVGVNSAIATTGSTFGGEAGNIGVGFAIPMEQVRITAAQILQTGEARYPVIGANVSTGGNARGAKVVGVPAGTPAAAAGLQKGDLVVAVNGKPVTDGIGLIVAIRSHQPGETVTLTVVRGGRQRDLRITLDSKVG